MLGETVVTQDLRSRLLRSDLRELIASDLLADPYPAYEDLRGDPVRMRSGTAVVTSYRDGATVLGDESFVRETLPRLPGRTMRTVAGLPIALNPPEHTRLRGAITPLVAPGALASVEQRSYEVAAEALAAGRRSGTLDVVSDLTVPVAMTVISDLLGIAPGDRAGAQGWAFRLNQAIDTPVPLRAARALDVVALLRHQRAGPRALAATRSSVRYAERVIHGSDHRGATGLVPALQALVADEVISREEAASIWLQVLLAGVDTVQTMLASAIWLLGEHPEQYELLAADASRIPGAIEEVLRYESPTRLFGRVVSRDTSISGLDLRCGDDVVVIFGAANRDPGAFAEPHRFDIARDRSRKHLAFSHGIHFCLGAQLARAEAGGALRALVDALGASPPRTSGPSWRRAYFMRSLDHVALHL